MMRLALGALGALLVTMSALLMVLMGRRLLLLRAARSRGRAVSRLRTIAAALVMDAIRPPPLPSGETALLAEVLSEFSRHITGTGREEIAAYFEEVGLVDEQLHELAARPGWRRAQAAYVLGDACSARAIPALITRLLDRDLRVRVAAARSLGRLRAGEAAGPIVEAIGRQRLPFVLAGAMLIKIGATETVELRQLLGHPDAQARTHGAELIGILGSTDDTALLHSLLADPAPSVRGQACLALGRLGTEDAMGALLNLLDDADAGVRAAAAEALGELQAERAVAVLCDRAASDEFEPARACADAVARIDPDALMALASRPDAGQHLAEAASRVRAAGR